MALQAQTQPGEGDAPQLFDQPTETRLLQGPQGEPVEATAADLPAGKGPFLHQEHPCPLAGQLMGGQGTGGSGPQHDHIPVGRTHPAVAGPSGRRQLSR